MKQRTARLNGRGDKLTPHPGTEAARLGRVWHFMRAHHVDAEGRSGHIAVALPGANGEYTFHASVFGVTVAFETADVTISVPPRR